MNAERAGSVVGCLLIDEITAGMDGISGHDCFQGLEGVAVHPFRCPDAAGMWAALQTALQQLRAEFAGASIIARGTGCAAALALAAQLPVDRLTLIEPAFKTRMAGARRLERFARRNLSLCVTDILAVESSGGRAVRALCAGGMCAHSRLTWLRVREENGLKLYANGEKSLNQAVSCFLRTGELPKSLAENPEMCIIYG